MTKHEKTDTICRTFSTKEGSTIMKGHDDVAAMKALHEKGHSATKIAQLLECSHHTVLKYSQAEFAPPSRSRRRGALDGHQDFLTERFLRHDGNADVVRQELAAELDIHVSLRTVERAVKPMRELLRAARSATRRFETKPGEQMQIDFGTKQVMIEGRQQRVHVFAATLGYSRRVFVKAYAQETQVEWFDGMEAAFAYFGGVPRTVLMDNAKALVATPRRDGAAAEFHDRLMAFGRYWGFVPKACAPYRARTKGKVERSVGYVKGNALAGRTFASWGELDRHLASWQATVADQRHLEGEGDTPLTRFVLEHDHLQSVAGRPPFGTPRLMERTVTADATIVLDTNHYSVPWSLIGQRVQVDLLPDTVRILDHSEPVAEHSRCVGRHQRQVDPAHWQWYSTSSPQVLRDGSLARPLSAYAELVDDWTSQHDEQEDVA